MADGEWRMVNGDEVFLVMWLVGAYSAGGEPAIWPAPPLTTRFNTRFNTLPKADS